MERFKRLVEKMSAEPPVIKEVVESRVEYVSISLTSLRTLDHIVGQVLGVVPAPRRSAAMAEVGSIMHSVAAKKLSDVPTNRTAQETLLLDIRKRLEHTDFSGWKADARKKLIAKIDKVV